MYVSHLSIYLANSRTGSTHLRPGAGTLVNGSCLCLSDPGPTEQ